MTTAPRSHDDAPLWAAVDEALDVGVDPFDDARVQAWLVEHPEDLARLDELLVRLQLVATAAVVDDRTDAGAVSATDVTPDVTPDAPSAASRPSPLRYAASIGLLGFVLVFAWRAVAVGGASAPAADRADGSSDANAHAPHPAGPAAAGRRAPVPAVVADAPGARVLSWSVRSLSVGAAGRVELVERPGGDMRRAEVPRRRPGCRTEPNPSPRGRILAASFRSSTWSSR